MLRKVLIVDDSPAIREILSMYVEAFCAPEILVADCGNTAFAIIEKTNDLDLVISDFNMPNGTGGELYHKIRTHELNLPFILQTAEPLELLEEFSNFPSSHFEGFLQKPFTLAEVEELLVQITDNQITDDYKSVPIETFLRYSKVGVDLFIKLSAVKFIKLFKGTDEIDLEIIKKYQAKGVCSFFIKTSDFKLFIDACSQDLLNKLMSPNLSAEDMAKIKLDTSENILSSLEMFGIDSFTLEQTKQLANNIVSSVPSKSELAALLKQLSNDSYLAPLSQLTANISVALVDKISWGNSKLKSKLATAAFFMDCSIAQSKELAKEGVNVTYFSSERYRSLEKSIREHAQRSADLYDTVDSDSDIFNLITDHHERPHGKGFPKGVDSNNISSLAAVFILAHEFSHRLLSLDHIDLTSFNAVKIDILSTFREGKYLEPLKAFSSIFC